MTTPTPAQVEAAKALKMLCEEITDREGREGMTDFDFAEQVIALAQSMKPKADAALTEVGDSQWQQVANQGIHIETQLRKEMLTLEARTIERCAQVADQFAGSSLEIRTARVIAAAIRALLQETDR